MTKWELIQKLTEGEPDALIHFKVSIDADRIKELAEDGTGLDGEPFIVDEIFDDETDVDINLRY